LGTVVFLFIFQLVFQLLQFRQCLMSGRFGSFDIGDIPRFRYDVGYLAVVVQQRVKRCVMQARRSMNVRMSCFKPDPFSGLTHSTELKSHGR
jgi:hypothetical protein